ncbi:MAG: metalloprotease TldD [Gammaproteobacteria bacterium]|nr:metalloprotease TldD [Gammaproteobacteria bacterium]
MSNTTPQSIDAVMSRLLEPAGLGEQQLTTTLGTVMRGGVDYADLYFQVSRQESWTLEDGIIREGSFSLDQGVGVRATCGEKTGFAYSDELVLPALEQAAGAARAIARQGQEMRVRAWRRSAALPLYPLADPTSSIDDAQKTALLLEIDAATRELDKRVEQVVVSLSSSQELILVASSDGTLAADVRPLIRLNVSVILEQDGQREQGYAGGGARADLHYFIDGDLPIEYAREAVRQAVVQLEAQPAPAGTMPVVLGSGWPGILLHEAVGHGLEGDFNRKGVSAFSGKLGQKVASKLCTIVDDGTIANRRGSLSVDDEGTPGQNTVLVEDGILRGYMQDKLNARLMGVKPTGNGRRESFAHIPMPRMTNTYMLAGPHDPDEIIASVDKGLYAPNFGGGQVDITSGKFVFSASEAYLIEKGKVTTPVKGAMLIGDGPEALHEISMVGTDLKLDTGVGTCGKEGQSVPVGVGQPTLKIDELTVGGTA